MHLNAQTIMDQVTTRLREHSRYNQHAAITNSITTSITISIRTYITTSGPVCGSGRGLGRLGPHPTMILDRGRSESPSGIVSESLNPTGGHDPRQGSLRIAFGNPSGIPKTTILDRGRSESLSGPRSSTGVAGIWPVFSELVDLRRFSRTSFTFC